MKGHRLTDFDVVFYHSPCADGYTCRFIAELKNPAALFIGLDVRKPFPVEQFDSMKGKRVIMMDIAFDEQTMLRINNIASFFVVIDHHETNQKVLGDLSFAQFDMTKAACHMVWEYFNAGIEMPVFIEYIGLRDIWKHKENKNALYFTNGFSCPEYDFKYFCKYYSNNDGNVMKTIEQGKLLHEYQQHIVEQICKAAIHHEDKYIIVNSHFPFISDIGDYLRERYPSRLVIIWNKKFGDPMYRYSVRSAVDGPNSAKFAEQFGGGGHAGAAGFGSEKSPEQLLN